MVSTIQWTWTRMNFLLQKGLPYCTSGHETSFPGATLIEIGVCRGTPPFNHLVYTTTSCLTSHNLSTQMWKTLNHFIILKTSLMRPPRYHDQGFMAQHWSHQQGSTVFFNFSVLHYGAKKKMCVSWTMENLFKELKFRSGLYEENFSQAEGSPAYPSFPGRGNISHISLQKRRTV